MKYLSFGIPNLRREPKMLFSFLTIRDKYKTIRKKIAYCNFQSVVKPEPLLHLLIVIISKFTNIQLNMLAVKMKNVCT